MNSTKIVPIRLQSGDRTLAFLVPNFDNLAVFRSGLAFFEYFKKLLQSAHFFEALTCILPKFLSVTLFVVSIALSWNLCRILEVFQSSVSEQRIMYAVCVSCGRWAVD